MSDEYLSLSGKDPRATRPTFQVGNAVSTAFSTMFVNLVPFLTLAVLAYVPAILLTWYGVTQASTMKPGTPLWGYLALFFLALIVSTQLTTAFVTVAVFRSLRGRRVSLAECLTTGLRKTPVALGTALAVGLLAGLGFMLCIVPGVVVTLMYLVAVPVAIVENKGIRDAMERSKNLTEGNRWLLLAVQILTALATALPSNVGQLLLAQHPMIAVVWGTSCQVIGNTFQAVLVCVIYYQLRASVEDMELADLAAVFD